MSKTILITGVGGYIGKYLLKNLMQFDYKIIGIDLVFDDEFRKEFDNKVIMLEGNLLNKNFINSSVKNYAPDYVFHLAASKSRSNQIQQFKTSNEINYLGTLTLFEALLDCKNLKLVTLLGTIEEYGQTTTPFREDSNERPDSAYGLSKLTATKLALLFNHQFNLPTVVLRPSIAYGPGQGEEMFIPALIKSLLKQEPFKMTEGNQLRDFIYIDDLIDALVKCVNSVGIEGQIINIAYGTSVKLKDIAWQIAEMANSKENLLMGEISYRNSEIMNYSVDISKVSKLFNWSPQTSLTQGLEKTIKFYQKSILDEA
tara:strand:+ start:61 stop:1002 length:942 start_codon:yes stop_codon:yes gene_type:complete